MSGIIIGYLNSNTQTNYLLPNDSDPLNLFKFSLIKHTIILIFIFINSFSMIGFPLTATSLVVSGYFVATSTATLLIGYSGSKIDFIISNFPQTSLVITAIFLLSEAVFKFSHYLFVIIFKAGYKNSFYAEIKRLFTRFFISIIIVTFAAIYEAYIL